MDISAKYNMNQKLRNNFFILNKNDNRSLAELNNNIKYKNITIPKNILVNKVNSRNKINKLILLKKDGILKFNETPKLIVNNTFIDNYNNQNIININCKKGKQNIKTPNLYKLSKHKRLENFL